MENIFIGLIPALMWGIQPLVMQTLGGKPGNQQMGMVMGTFLFAVGVLLFRQPEVWTLNLILSSFACGVIWALGQINQIGAFPLIGVSRAMPISTGTQLVGTSLVGVLYFHEWDTTEKLLLGFGAIAIIIIGVAFTAYQENKGATENRGNMKRGIIMLLFSSLFFVGYAVIPRVANVSGWDAVFPQAIGMFLGTFIICRYQKEVNVWDKTSFKNIITGFIFATANLTMMLSNQLNGVAVGFTLSQMNVIVSTLGGLLLLKEKKTAKELLFVLFGLALVAGGGILIGLTKA